MELTLFEQTLVWAFAIAFVMSIFVVKTNFCTMGAVSDWVNMNDTGRLRSWIFAMGTAILGVTILDSLSVLDITMASNGQTGKPPYLSPQFSVLRYVLGGLLFGIGMSLGSGCGNKTFVRVGGGNLKSVFVFLAMGAGAYLMIYTDFGHTLFLQWLPSIDLTTLGLSSQSISGAVGSLAGGASFALMTALLIGALLVISSFTSQDFRANADNIVGGLVVGIAIVLAWYVTAGALGQTLLEEADFMDTRPYDIGAQSFTFVKPTAQFYYWTQNAFSSATVSFALIAALGVVSGSLVYSLLSKSFRIEWFADNGDIARHLIGGFLMGIGGVLSIGCTFGQAISGASTLALGSFITFASIVAGAAFTMKFQYYRLVYEDEATIGKTIVTVLCDFKFLPASKRQLAEI